MNKGEGRVRNQEESRRDGVLSGGIIEAMSEDFAGVTYAVPYAASLLTTSVPARQVSKVSSAETLRYE